MYSHIVQSFTNNTITIITSYIRTYSQILTARTKHFLQQKSMAFAVVCQEKTYFKSHAGLSKTTNNNNCNI